jgi:mono/diheme cytochrome c family protein
VVAGVTPTAGGVTFTGDLAGNLLVFNSKTGELAHRAQTGGSLAGGVVTYEAGGRQYLAFAAGNVSRNAFGALGLPSVVVMALNPQRIATSPAASNPAARGPAGAPNLAAGRKLYNQVCVACHGPDGNLVVDHKLGALKSRQSLASTIASIKDPKLPMPKMFPDLLNEQAIAEVAAFLHEELK